MQLGRERDELRGRVRDATRCSAVFPYMTSLLPTPKLSLTRKHNLSYDSLRPSQSENDRVGLLHVLSTLERHPESVPVNALVAVKGTPLGDSSDIDEVDAFDMARVIATARIVMPRTMVRLSAGR